MNALFPLIITFGLMWVLLIRPQQRRVRQHQAVVSSLTVGDEVVTTGGLIGTIEAIDEEVLTLAVAPGVSIRMLRSAVQNRIGPDEGGPDEGDTDEVGPDEVGPDEVGPDEVGTDEGDADEVSTGGVVSEDFYGDELDQADGGAPPEIETVVLEELPPAPPVEALPAPDKPPPDLPPSRPQTGDGG